MAKIGNVGLKTNISDVVIGSGLFVYCTDTHELFVDYPNGSGTARGAIKMSGNEYVSAVTISGSNLKVTKGDGSVSNVPIGNYAGSSSNGGAANSVKSNLVVKLNGGTTEGDDMFTFNGSTAKSINVTPASIGAAATSHSHTTANITDLTDKLNEKLDADANAVSASKLATARTITLTGDVSGSTSFDGSGNVSITTTVADDSHNHVIGNVDGLQDALDEKLDATATATAATKLANSRSFSIIGGATASAVSFNGTGNVELNVTSLDATKLDGIISIDNLPAGALERLVPVENETAMYALTTDDVQLGDTVQNLETGIMYLVVDTSNLNSAAGYKEYTAGSASSVPWSGVTGKPSTFTPATHTHQIVEISGLQDALDDKLDATATAVAASKLATARTISLTGDVTGSTSFDGSGNVSIATTAKAMTAASSSTAGSAGVVPAPEAGVANRYLRCDATWAVPPDTNTTYSNMTGSTASAAGSAGLVPAPAAGAANRYLRCDGTWQVPPDTNTTYTLGSFGITATAAELNKLDGVTVSATQINYLSGVTSAIQTQINNLSSRITTAQNTANNAKSVTDKYSAMLNIIGNGQ